MNPDSTPLPTRRQRNRESTIQTILDTARHIMREKGVAGLSMQELARRMEMRAPSLYNYFSGLMDVYDSLFRLGFTLWGRHLADVTQGAQTWQEEIHLAIEAYMTFAKANPELYQLCFERPVPGFTPSEKSMQLSLEILQSGYNRLGAWKNQLNTDLSTVQTVDLVIAIMHGLTALHMANEPHAEIGQGRFGSLIPAVMGLLNKAWAS